MSDMIGRALSVFMGSFAIVNPDGFPSHCRRTPVRPRGSDLAVNARLRWAATTAGQVGTPAAWGSPRASSMLASPSSSCRWPRLPLSTGRIWLPALALKVAGN